MPIAIGMVTDWPEFLSPDLQVIKDYRMLEEVAGRSMTLNVLVEAEDVTNPEVMGWMMQFEQQVASAEAEKIGSVSSAADLLLQFSGGQMPEDSQQIKYMLANMPPEIVANLVSADYTAANIVLNIKSADTEGIAAFPETLTAYFSGLPSGVDVTVTGSALIQVELLNALSSGRELMTGVGIAFVFAGLFILFRFSIIKALLAIIPIGLILGWSSGFMYFTGIDYTPVTATLGTLIMGIGVEFTVILMMRYYEERGKGEGTLEAMMTAMTKIGRAIIASGLTVIAGFGALLIARDFPILRDFGIITMIDVLLALASTLFVLPPLIVWIDNWRERRKVRG